MKARCLHAFPAAFKEGGRRVVASTGGALSQVNLVASRPLRVLVVEDSVDAAEALGLQLREWGYGYRICASGNEALALIPHFRPNVVLIDIGLPDMSGWELARYLPSDAVLIAVSACGEDDDFRRSQHAGIGYHLVKPAYQRQLRELLQRIAPAVQDDSE
jgi:CheY-like chemotaxis protein